MSNHPLFKRAFVRGLNAELIRQGVAVYPSKEAADATADFVADEFGMPDPYFEGEKLNEKVAYALMDCLVRGADEQCKAAGGYSPELNKTAAAQDPASWAAHDAMALMEKSAAEAGDNTLSAAAANSEAAARELRERPEGYANSGEGGAERPAGGVEGKEGEPSAPGTENNKKVPGENSATKATKNASLQEIIRRVGKTASNVGPNDMNSARENSSSLDKEMEERPENYANHGEHQGRTEFNIGPDAQTGKEEEHEGVVKLPETQGTNSVIDMVGGTNKSAFDHLFEQTAIQILPHLPERMEETQKVAHIRRMVGLETEERGDYLASLYSQLGAKKEAAQSVRQNYLKQASDEKDEDGNKKPAGEKADRPWDEQVGKSVDEPRKVEPERKKDAAAKPQSATPLSALHQRLRSLHA